MNLGRKLGETRPATVGSSATTLWLDDIGRVCTIDQTQLPFAAVTIILNDCADCVRAINTMQVRGAPLIGVVAAYGLALALRRAPDDASLAAVYAQLLATRPTAVNLRWALDRVRAAVEPASERSRAELAWSVANQIRDEDIRCNSAIGEHAARLLQPLIERARATARPLNLMTHCNAGALATVAYGTALAPIYLLHEQGVAVHVWVDETRPRNQGASLTAWELARAGIAHTVVSDNAGGLLMMRGQVDAVIVGCDRVSANGDVVNKVGTYLKALAAAAHAIPFYVCCPLSTIDLQSANGASVPIEERSADEVRYIQGMSDDQQLLRVRLVPTESACANPAFDITPAALVTGLVTERGACAANETAIRQTCSVEF